MEKTVRVCDECGAEKEHTPWWGECIICGKDLCDDCASFLFDRESLSIALCPAHYKQVKEFIEGLKGEEVWQESERKRDADFNFKMAAWGRCVPKGLKPKDEVVTEIVTVWPMSAGGYYLRHENGACYALPAPFADALREYIRRERED